MQTLEIRDVISSQTLTLEFADGTAMRPIVRAAKNEEIEKDNITSIAVLLKNKPNKKGGIFYYNDYKNRPADPTIILSHLAPAIDANLIFYVGEKNVSCVRSNDWKNMNVADILLRSYHSPYPANEYDIKKFNKISSRMRTIGNSDNIYGVACIVSWNIWEKYGLLIVGGLKAQYLTGIAGFMFGSTQNAARNSAVPLAPPEMLANWASEQAFLISSLADVDDEFKANCAGVVLACGGDIKDLPIIRKGGEYINTHDFVDYLNNTNFIKLIDESDLDYDDENDDVLGRDYKNHFALDEDIIVIPSRTLANPLGQNNSWPYESHIRPTKPITLLDYFKQIVSDTWGEYYESDHHTDECICTVRSVEIIRQIEIWEREEKLSIYPEYERALSDPSDPDSPF